VFGTVIEQPILQKFGLDKFQKKGKGKKNLAGNCKVLK